MNEHNSEHNSLIPDLSHLEAAARYRVYGIASRALHAAAFIDVEDTVGELFTTNVQHPEITIGRDAVLAALGYDAQAQP